MWGAREGEEQQRRQEGGGGRLQRAVSRFKPQVSCCPAWGSPWSCGGRAWPCALAAALLDSGQGRGTGHLVPARLPSCPARFLLSSVTPVSR